MKTKLLSKKNSRVLVTFVLIILSAIYGKLSADPIEQLPIQNPESAQNELTNKSVSSTQMSGTNTLVQVLNEEMSYYSNSDVALYLYTFDKLPQNYLTKAEAIALGWDNEKGNLWDVTDKMVIGGDVFGNREGLLPSAKGRTWFECDVNYDGGYRNADRIVFSSDGLIYYTSDHYASFTKIYD